MRRQSIILIFAILLTSCNSLAVNSQSPSSSASPAPGITDSSTQASSSGIEATWQTYENAKAGFSIQYPSNWQEQDLPDEANGQRHHITLTGPEGAVDLIWGSGLGGACPEGYQPIAVVKGNWQACHSQREDGTDFWSLSGPSVGETGFAGFASTNDTTDKSRAIVLKVISTLSIP